MSANIETLDTKSFETTLAQGKAMLVDFYAPWCGPCKMLAPMLEGIAGKYAGKVAFYKVNVDDAPELAMRFDITGVPTIILFKDGAVKSQLVGVPAPAKLTAQLDALNA